MKKGRISLVFLYLVMMVLVPVSHISFEHCTANISAEHCAHATTEQQHNSSRPLQKKHPEESCEICQLMQLQIDSPEVPVEVHGSALIETLNIQREVFTVRQFHFCQNARAPPFKTV